MLGQTGLAQGEHGWMLANPDFIGRIGRAPGRKRLHGMPGRFILSQTQLTHIERNRHGYARHGSSPISFAASKPISHAMSGYRTNFTMGVRRELTVGIIQLALGSGLHDAGQTQIIALCRRTHGGGSRIEIGKVAQDDGYDGLGKIITARAHDLERKIAGEFEQGFRPVSSVHTPPRIAPSLYS
jgi:hypothetical protein